MSTLSLNSLNDIASSAPDAWESLRRDSMVFCLTQGQTLLSQHGTTARVFYVQRGTLRVWTYGADGKLVTLNFAGPNELIGDLRALDGLGHSANVTALEPCELLAFETVRFCDEIERVPALSLQLARLQSWRLRMATEHIMSLATQKARERIARQLLLLSGRFPGAIDGTTVPIALRLTHDDIASLACVTRNTTQSSMQYLRKSKFIANDVVRCRVTVFDRERLAFFCGGTESRSREFRLLYGLPALSGSR